MSALGGAAEMEESAFLAAIVGSSSDAIVGQTLDGTIVTWNPGAERLYGYSAGEAIGQSIEMLMPPGRERELDAIFERVRAGGEVAPSETLRRRKDGTGVEVSVTVSPVRSAGGAIVGASSIERDLTDRRRAEESYRRLFERHPSPMWLFDLGTLRFLEVNASAVATYGWTREQFLGMTIELIRPEEERAALHEAVRDLAAQGAHRDIWRHVYADGSVHEVAVSWSTIEFEGRTVGLVLALDMTEQRRLEQQLVQAHKLEAVGALAAGVAHDFNNVLMVIRACSALLLKAIAGDERRDVEQIDEAAQRGAELTRQLLAFSKQQVLRPELTDVNVVVHQTLELLERLIGEDVDIALELASELPPIMVDRGQLGQVIVNLAVNARDAMPEGGTLAVSTAAVELDSDYAFAHVGVEAGSYVRIQLADTGTGMSGATKEHVFEPFFTTKEAGTGLGLSTVHGIVKQSGGHIWLYSEPGLGTAFKIYFPVAEAPAVRRVKPPAAPHGTETVLFVEDEETVRVLVAETLRSYGYTLLEAGSGDEALRIASEHQGEIDLLLTDVAIPGVNGHELAERLVGAQPQLPVVYTCGYPPDADASSRMAYVEKPYDPAELARAMRALLDAA
jgi:PAS domain S-box-containing protein